jgi:medium-chain acyl-[acyl-carrier-protein] hydrolase
MTSPLTAFTANRWIEYAMPNPAAHARLFCFPYAGGSASIYRHWHQSLTRCEVCPVQLPGRERRISEAPYERAARLVQAAVAHLPADKPFAFFGHSMGALLAFEAARELRRRGMPQPFHLFVSGAPAPHLCPNRPPRYRLERKKFLAEIRELGGTPEEALANDELLDLMLPVLRADFAVIDTYVYRELEPLACPVTAFAGENDREVDPADVMRWRAQTAGAFSFHQFPGDHFFLNDSGLRIREIVASAMS